MCECESCSFWQSALPPQSSLSQADLQHIQPVRARRGRVHTCMSDVCLWADEPGSEVIIQASAQLESDLRLTGQKWNRSTGTHRHTQTGRERRIAYWPLLIYSFSTFYKRQLYFQSTFQTIIYNNIYLSHTHTAAFVLRVLHTPEASPVISSLLVKNILLDWFDKLPTLKGCIHSCSVGITKYQPLPVWAICWFQKEPSLYSAQKLETRKLCSFYSQITGKKNKWIIFSFFLLKLFRSSLVLNASKN